MHSDAVNTPLSYPADLPHRKVAGVALAALAVAFLAYAGKVIVNGSANSHSDATLYCAIVLSAAGLCVARGVSSSRERSAWLLMGAGVASWGFGEWYFNFGFSGEEIPYPSWADAGYLAFYLPVYVALWQLARHRLPRMREGMWLDGLIAILAVATLSITLLLGPITGAVAGTPRVVATTLAYPIGDLVLLGMLGLGLGMTGWKMERSMLAILVALGMFWVADTAFLVGTANETYVDGGIMSLGWPACAVLLAGAAWVRPPVLIAGVRRGEHTGIVAPLACTAAVAGLLLFGNSHEVNILAQCLAAATLAAVLVRVYLVFRDSQRLGLQMRTASLTDELTGLGNRRKLMNDVEDAISRLDSGTLGSSLACVVFDLNGFKSFNDTHGHPAGDRLLRRLAQQLAEAVSDHGEAYRLGGDEFCVFVPADENLNAQVKAAAAALAEDDTNYSVDAAYGVAVLPEEASTLAAAMRLADNRMYAQKASGRNSAGTQMRNILLRALAEKSEALGDHNDDVAELAGQTARQMGLDDEHVAEVIRAAELHDVGKVVIPDDILFKPGPLSDVEWETMHMHTVIGERILAAAPALKSVGRLVRSSHERWDGAGYPDGLKGESIPLGARIVAVCDAFDAMTTDRPYRKGTDEESALAELRRCAGGQFDPAVVKSFCSLMEQRRSSEPAGTVALTA